MIIITIKQGVKMTDKNLIVYVENLQGAKNWLKDNNVDFTYGGSMEMTYKFSDYTHPPEVINYEWTVKLYKLVLKTNLSKTQLRKKGFHFRGTVEQPSFY